MHDCCAAHAYSGCCAGTGCTSGAVPLIRLDEQITDSARARRAMVDRMIAGNVAVLALAVFALSYLFVGIPEMQRWAKVEKENIVMETSR